VVRSRLAYRDNERQLSGHPVQSRFPGFQLHDRSVCPSTRLNFTGGCRQGNIHQRARLLDRNLGCRPSLSLLVHSVRRKRPRNCFFGLSYLIRVFEPKDHDRFNMLAAQIGRPVRQ
jgi:hypothetical protein